jgi:TPR repeat protein
VASQVRESTKDPRGFERLDVFAKLTVGVGTLVLSAAIGFATIHYNRQAAQLQIQNQIDALALQRRATAARILVDELPTIVSGADPEQGLILKLLEVLDPDFVRQFGERLLAGAQSPEDTERAEEIIAGGVRAAQEQAVPLHLENASRFMVFNAYPAAAREYLRAFEAMPAPTRAQVSDQAEKARELYEKGDFSGAARSFAEAFQELEQSPQIE